MAVYSSSKYFKSFTHYNIIKNHYPSVSNDLLTLFSKKCPGYWENCMTFFAHWTFNVHLDKLRPDISSISHILRSWYETWINQKNHRWQSIKNTILIKWLTYNRYMIFFKKRTIIYVIKPLRNAWRAHLWSWWVINAGWFSTCCTNDAVDNGGEGWAGRIHSCRGK